MRTSEAMKPPSRLLLTMLSFLSIGLLIVGVEYERAACRVSVLGVMSQAKTEDNQSLEYHVWRVFPQDRRGFTIVVASVNPRHFNREDMIALAMQLNREFADKGKLKVGLLDDDKIARLFATGRAEYSTYELAERGRYYLDRSGCREYIQFSNRRKKPRTKVTIRQNCSDRSR